MARFVYEVVLTPDEEDANLLNVVVPDIEGCFTFGEGVNDALNMADDAIRTCLAALLLAGEEIPEPTFGRKSEGESMVIALSVETDAGYIIDGISPSEAAAMLGVSRSRVSQMIQSGKLVAHKGAAGTLVDKASVLARAAEPRKPGRPRKLLST